MPGTWNVERYESRATEWREKAEALPPGNERDVSLVLADGYATLVDIVRSLTRISTQEAAFPAHGAMGSGEG